MKSASILFLTFFSIQTIHEKKDILLPNDLPTQPKIFFHGSHNKNIKKFTPQSISPRNKSEGDVVFGTPHLAFAAVFTLPHKKDRGFLIRSGSISNGPLFLLCDSKENLLKHDKGGAIYFLPTEGFYCDLGLYGISRNAWLKNPSHYDSVFLDQWVTKKPVTPIYKFEFDSTLTMLLDLGMQVFFTSKENIEKYNTSNEEERRQLLISLTSENEIEKRNFQPIPIHDKTNQSGFIQSIKKWLSNLF